MEQYVGRYSSSAESPTQDWTMLRYQTTSVRETGSANHTSAQTDCELATLGACNYNYQYYIRKFLPALMGENFIPQTIYDYGNFLPHRPKFILLKISII